MKVIGFAFARLVVADGAALQRFYCDVLGLTFVLRVDHGEGYDAFVERFLSVEPGTPPQVVLMQYLNRTAPAPGEVVLALQVDDLDAVLVAVESHGGRVTVGAQDIPEHNMRLAFAQDPEGHAIEFIQMISK